MIEFFAGFFVGVTATLLSKLAGWVARKDFYLINKIESNDFDYNEGTGDLSVEDILKLNFSKEGTV